MDDQLKKGYIRPSKSPQMLPVFFVSKKNESKRMVMHYKTVLKKEILLHTSINSKDIT